MIDSGPPQEQLLVACVCHALASAVSLAENVHLIQNKKRMVNEPLFSVGLSSKD